MFDRHPATVTSQVDLNSFLETLHSLKERFNEAAEKLESLLIAPLREGRRPDGAVLEECQALVSKYDLAVEISETVQLPVDQGLDGMITALRNHVEAAAKIAESRTAALRTLNDLRQLAHSSGSLPPYLIEVHSRAQDLISELPDSLFNLLSFEWNEKLKPFISLHRLLKDIDALSEEVADTLLDDVQAAFGYSLVKAIAMRKLLLPNLPSDEVEIAEHTQSVAIITELPQKAEAAETRDPCVTLAADKIAVNVPAQIDSPSAPTSSSRDNIRQKINLCGKEYSERYQWLKKPESNDSELRQCTSAHLPYLPDGFNSNLPDLVEPETNTRHSGNESQDPEMVAEEYFPARTTSLDEFQIEPEFDSGGDIAPKMPAPHVEVQDKQSVSEQSTNDQECNAPENSIPELLEPNCHTYESFTKNNYIGVDDNILLAWWWNAPQESIQKIRQHFEREWHYGRLNRIWVYCEAIRALGSVAPYHPEDLAALSELAEAPNRAAAGIDPMRLERLRIGNLEPFEDLRLPLFLEALRPSEGNPLDDENVKTMIESANFQSVMLSGFVKKCLYVHARGFSAIQILKQRKQAAALRTKDVIQRELLTKRREFHNEVVKLWKAAGGRLQHTHCRDAWDRFMQKIEGTLKVLYPPPYGQVRWNTIEVGRKIAEIKDIHRRIADKGDVKYGDRNRSDNAAESLQELATSINELMREFVQAEGQNQEVVEDWLPITELNYLLQAQESGNFFELLCQQIVQQIFYSNQTAIQCSSLELASVDLLVCPELLDTLPASAWSYTEGKLTGNLRNMPSSESIRAAEYLMKKPFKPLTGDLTLLVDHLIQRPRYDLLRILNGVKDVNGVSLLAAPQREAMQRGLRGVEREVVDLMSKLHGLWRNLTEMASRDASYFGRAYKQAADLSRDQLNKRASPALLLEWLTTVCHAAEQSVQNGTEALRVQTIKLADDATRETILALIDNKKFEDALYRLGIPSPEENRWKREISPRDKATQEYKDPLKCLKVNAAHLGSAMELVNSWIAGLQVGVHKDRSLRTQFSRLIASVRSDRHADKPIGVNENDKFIIDCLNITKWFVSQNLNPSFFPQLRRYKNLVILTPTTHVDSHELVERVRYQTAAQKENLCLVLTPRLQEATRQELLQEFRNTQLSAAVLDDLDLCRLLNPGGRRPIPLVGLLEIIFEQQMPKSFSPYERHDGQHVRMEMFVGRSEQARDIAQSPRYSRLFSGRKLGKSALLSYVKEKYDNTLLPSQNRLRVVYVSGVGAGEEQEFVTRVLDTMRSRLGYVAPPAELNPGQTLAATFKAFCQDHPAESLLILFDEADLFVERQIDEYEQRHENCLSFVIRSLVEEEKDASGLPRIRFLFSGYRVTHRNAGAWAGAWGEVLLLEPLLRDEASTLVRGPLERLGLDAGKVSGLIAWRCGYQPSIIISFCRQLLEQNARGEITPDDVARSFDDPKTQDEIRSVIESNFQGNNLARIVFLATIGIFNQRQSPYGEFDLPERVVNLFSKIWPDFTWYQKDSGRAAFERVVPGIIKDFVRRQLLYIRSEEGKACYYPSFPHHIPILAQDLSRNLDNRLKEELTSYEKSRGSTPDVRGPILSLFPRSTIDRFRELAATAVDKELPLRAIVIGSSWLPPIPDGLIRPEIAETSPKDLPAVLQAQSDKIKLLIKPADSAAFDYFLEHGRNCSFPTLFVGGVDLLRTALEKAITSDELLEIEALGRLTRANIEWWFHKKRAVEASSNGYDRIVAETSGIPWLVSLFDTILSKYHHQGASLSEQEAEQLWKEYHGKLEEHVRKLLNGPPEVSLNKREIEILKMVARVSEQTKPGNSIANDLTEDWDGLYADSLPVQAIGPLDTVAMQLLCGLGFLPASPEGRRHFPLERFIGLAPEDALHRILKFL